MKGIGLNLWLAKTANEKFLWQKCRHGRKGVKSWVSRRNPEIRFRDTMSQTSGGTVTLATWDIMTPGLGLIYPDRLYSVLTLGTYRPVLSIHKDVSAGDIWAIPGQSEAELIWGTGILAWNQAINTDCTVLVWLYCKAWKDYFSKFPNFQGIVLVFLHKYKSWVMQNTFKKYWSFLRQLVSSNWVTGWY